VKYRLRASLVNKLLHHYAAFHSRPGIIEFPSRATNQTILYFAYGSNMLTSRLKSRVPSAVVVGTGHLEGYRLAFDKVSDNGSGTCAMRVGTPEDRVHGVLFTVDAAQRSELDRHEGLGLGYQYRPITVTTVNGPCEAGAYWATSIDETLRPFDWYRDLVLAGAIEHNLPDAYVEALRKVEVRADKDGSRAAANRTSPPAK
jgi:gamma-glutamylcyclotransferase (GGCT)/AIG2-like uncharacterized protein YtfP